MNEKNIKESISELSKEIVEINKSNGWNVLKPEEWDDEYKILAILDLIHSEVSEATEAFRHNDFENFKEELADVIIRVLDCSGGLEIDITDSILNKLEKNRNRGYKHGGKRV